MRAFVALLIAVSSALAQGGGVYRVGGGVSAPALLSKVEPQYSEEARQARYQGTVLLYIEVDPEGKPTNIRVQRALGLGLNEKAIEAVKAWRFKPGSKDGNPVTVAASIEVNFRMSSHWSIARQEFSTTGDAAKPALHGWAFPPECKQTPAEVTLAVDVNSHGAVTGARVLQSSDPSLDEGVVAAVQKWNFIPARWQGTTQPAGAEVELACKP
jgi:TonB family protein